MSEMPPRHSIGLIVDDGKVSRWQAEALSTIGDTAEFLVLNCTNTQMRRQPVRHALYYALNLISLKSPLTERVPLPPELMIRKVVSFAADAEGGWQRLPAKVCREIAERPLDCIIKFGMGLLRMPPLPAPPIVSYHHGDPRRFRGRPAGFYELLTGERAVGQIVQILSEKLDAGEVLAFCETPTYAHSYRKTMTAAYRRSPLLMKRAIERCLAGERLALESTGKNYRLPSNATVLKFAGRILVAKARRLLYGLFVEKQWEVAEARVSKAEGMGFPARLPPVSDWKVAQRPNRHRFLADPFPHPEGGILVEALRSSDQQGEIVHISAAGARTLSSGAGHYSYPATIGVDGRWYVVPEIAEWSPPRLFQLEGRAMREVAPVDIDGTAGILDPTFLCHDGDIYLFGNRADEGSDVLRLWSSKDLFSRFVEHPASPVRISPLGARMGGSLFRSNGTLFRLGQDGSQSYGNGLIAFAVETLSRADYSEREVGRLCFGEPHGPHTLNICGTSAVFDFYTERRTPLAGLRRLRGAFSKRRARRGH